MCVNDRMTNESIPTPPLGAVNSFDGLTIRRAKVVEEGNLETLT